MHMKFFFKTKFPKVCIIFSQVNVQASQFLAEFQVQEAESLRDPKGVHDAQAAKP